MRDTEYQLAAELVFRFDKWTVNTVRSRPHVVLGWSLRQFTYDVTPHIPSSTSSSNVSHHIIAFSIGNLNR